MSKLGYVSGPRLCCCLAENAEICTMREGRKCAPALIDFEDTYDVLSENELDIMKDLEKTRKDINKISREVDKGISSLEKTVKHLKRRL